MSDQPAAPKKRFTILSVTIRMQEGQGPAVILSRHANKWSCLCDDYREDHECSHVLEAKQLSFGIYRKEDQ